MLLQWLAMSCIEYNCKNNLQWACQHHAAFPEGGITKGRLIKVWGKMEEEIGPKSCRALSLEHLSMLHIQVFYIVVKCKVSAPVENIVSIFCISYPACVMLLEVKSSVLSHRGCVKKVHVTATWHLAVFGYAKHANIAACHQIPPWWRSKCLYTG